MSIFKCKMCGGTIEFEQGATVGVCDSCGTKQTLPRLDDDKKANLYDRANHFRRNNDFDKAMSIYEQILNEDNTDAEAYWSLVLCRYGIEYVEDPASRKRIPTVNRAQFTSIFADEDYKSALQYADGYQKTIYEDEAKAIDEIQKGILAISQKEEPFDVFICYKETDANGRRTQDSVLANDLYHQLTEEGFKVFFSRITLEDKLGTAYEPYIFAALNSAKAMVVLGTKPEYFNAVWVKNEWSRYLALIKNGAKKTLIPAYRDMDPYDLPEEFSHLQAQDMSKLGFMQDLIRGIKKIISSDAPKATAKETVVVSSGNTNLSALLDRAFMFLEDGDWQSAGEYSEKVLDSDPRNATAYLGKLMAELHVRKREALADCADPFDNTNNYQKTMRFADESLRKELAGYIEHINARNEHDRLEGIYNNAETQKASAKTESDFKKAADVYSSIIGYRDAAEQEQICLEKAEDARKDAIYSDATSRASKRDIFEIEKAIELYRSISEWKDSSDRIYSCQERIEKIKVEDEQKRIQDAKDKKARTKKTVIGGSIAAACVAFMIVLCTVIIPSIRYSKAMSLYESGDYQEAVNAFESLNFKDAAEKYRDAFIALRKQYGNQAEEAIASGNNAQAAIDYIKAGDFFSAKSAFNIESLVYTGEFISAGIMSDGSLKYQTNYQYERDDAKIDLSGIVSFLYSTGPIAGLDANGHLLTHYAGSFGNVDVSSDMNINSYSNIVSIVHGSAKPSKDYVDYIVMLMADGSVKETHEKSGDPYPGVSKWESIKSIYAGYDNIIGITIDGKVLIEKEVGGDSENYNVSSLSDIKKIIECNDCLIALSNSGSISVVGNNAFFSSELSEKKHIFDICECDAGILLLYDNGMVEWCIEPSDSDDYSAQIEQYRKQVKDDVSNWRRIISIQAGASGIIGIRIDGTVEYVSTDIYYYSGYSAEEYKYDAHSTLDAELSSWEDIICISSASLASEFARDSANGWAFAIGIKTDGTAISTGDGTYYTTEKDSYGNGYHDVGHSGGSYNNVSSWKLWE